MSFFWVYFRDSIYESAEHLCKEQVIERLSTMVLGSQALDSRFNQALIHLTAAFKFWEVTAILQASHFHRICLQQIKLISPKTQRRF